MWTLMCLFQYYSFIHSPHMPILSQTTFLVHISASHTLFYRYVDGARYMWDVADVLEAAKDEIFITDWWMCPQIYLKRPDLTGHRWR